MRRLVVVLALALASFHSHAQNPTPVDWSTVSRFLALMQVFMQSAAANAGNDPRAAERAMDDILAGRNPEANRLMLEIFVDVPPAERERLMAIGRSMMTLSQRQAAAGAQRSADAVMLQARRDLTAMGLVYHDRGQFIDAVKRGDVLAVQLFLRGRGVDPAAKDVWGVSAAELARRGGNPEMMALFAALAPRAGEPGRQASP
jgi:hypothetical protein